MDTTRADRHRWIRTPWAWIAAILIALAVALQFVPLTRDLHYEFAAVIALATSLLGGVGGLASWVGRRPSTADVTRSAGLAVAISLAPLPIGILRNLVLSPCGIAEGVAWYLVLVPPAAFLSVVVALLAATLTRGRWIRMAVLAALWSGSLVRGAVEALNGPHIFLYAWQIGFFPGGSWDAELPITPLLLLYRAAHVLIGLALAGVLLELRTPIERARGTTLLVRAGLLAAAVVPLVFARADIGLTRTDAWLRAELGDSVRTRYATIYYDARSTDSLELWRAINYVDFHVEDHGRALGLAPGSAALGGIALYAYSSPAEQQRLVGTSSASFTKPWRRMLHLTFRRMPGTLRHELAHIVLEPYGNALGISWSNGVLEGWAVALDHTYDAARLHAHARAMRAFGLAPPVDAIMGIGGFASYRASVSYGIAGSFARWLLDTYGARSFRDAYATGSIERTYGQPFDSLVASYARSIDSLPAPAPADSARVRYQYGGGSFFLQRCLRRIGRLNGEGFAALGDNRFQEALSAFRASIDEGITWTARAGVLLALHGAGRYQEMLDSARAYDADTAGSSLLPYLVERSDALWQLDRGGDRIATASLAMAIGDDATRFRAALRLALADSAEPNRLREYFARSIPTAQRVVMLEDALERAPARFAPVLRLMLAAQVGGPAPLLAASIAEAALPAAWSQVAATEGPGSDALRVALSGLTRSLADARLYAHVRRGRSSLFDPLAGYPLESGEPLGGLGPSDAELHAFARWVQRRQ